MVLEQAAVAAGTAGTVFAYNRENYIYDRKMRQEFEHNVMDFRIKQAELWRSDVEEIIELTSVKMDTYLIVIAVEFGMAVMAFLEGHMDEGTPTWLIGSYILSLGGAFMYLLMSIWFAIQASVTSKSYKIRLLTQYVRLPMPTWNQLQGARTYMSSFERMTARQMFRVPFLGGSQEATLEADNKAFEAEDETHKTQSADPWGLEARGDHIYELDGTIRANPDSLHHLNLVRQALPHWQSYDAFSRATMSVGTNHLIHALIYYVLDYVVFAGEAPMAACTVVVILMFAMAGLIKMDMSLTGFEYFCTIFLVCGGPLIEAYACISTMESENPVLARGLTPLVNVAHALYLAFLLYICKVTSNEHNTVLPTGFRSVMYIDIFGWMHRRHEQWQQEQLEEHGAPPQPLPRPSKANLMRRSSTAPASLATSASTGCSSIMEAKRPTPTRPEDMPGAAKSMHDNDEQDEVYSHHFSPCSFTPRELGREGGVAEQLDYTRNMHPGLVPWRIFCSATVLLMILWIVAGAANVAELTGFRFFVISPLFEAPEDESREAAGDDGELPLELQLHAFRANLFSKGSLLAGSPLLTAWPPSSTDRPRSLACGAGNGLQADGGAWVVAAGRYRLFAARLGANGSSSTSSGGAVSVVSVSSASAEGTAMEAAISFEDAPLCSAAAGVGIQDLSLECPQGGPCRAAVLPSRGRELHRCRITDEGSEETAEEGEVLPTALLLEGRDDEAQGDEEFASIALTGHCDGGDERQGADAAAALAPSAFASGVCAYASTTKSRVVELQAGASDVLPHEGAEGLVGEGVDDRTPEAPAWLVSRSAKSEDELFLGERKGRGQHRGRRAAGAIVEPAAVLAETARRQTKLVRAGGRLLILHQKGKLSLLDGLDEDIYNSSEARGGKRKAHGRRTWQLPAGHRWSDACEAVGSLYALESGGAQPRIWQFNLPKELRPAAVAPRSSPAGLLQAGHGGPARKRAAAEAALAPAEPGHKLPETPSVALQRRQQKRLQRQQKQLQRQQQQHLRGGGGSGGVF